MPLATYKYFLFTILIYLYLNVYTKDMETLKYFTDKYPDISQKSLESLTKLATEKSLKKKNLLLNLVIYQNTFT